MTVEIKPDVFLQTDFKSLNMLIQILTYMQRYDLFVEMTKVQSSDLYQKLDEADKEHITALYNQAINNSELPSYFVSTKNPKKDTKTFDLEEAIRFFIQPVSIILENSLNDQYFLQAIITHFDASGKIQLHLDKGWLQFENAGGCDNVENFIEGKLQSFNYLADKYNKETHQYLRLFILLDSDKTFPTQELKASYKKLQAYLNPKDIQPFILQKRAMENYMPDEVIEYLTNIKQAWRDAYLHLTDKQKDYLSFDKGFAGKEQNQLPHEVQTIYATTSSTNYNILNQGIQLGNFKTEFPQNFTSHHQISKTTLTNRAQSTGADELEEIINKILALL